jgi:hypothetical protein
MNYTGEVDVGQARVAEGTLSFLYSKSRVEYNIALKYKDANGVPNICTIKDDFVSSPIWTALGLDPTLTYAGRCRRLTIMVASSVPNRMGIIVCDGSKRNYRNVVSFYPE